MLKTFISLAFLMIMILVGIQAVSDYKRYGYNITDKIILIFVGSVTELILICILYVALEILNK